MPKHKPLASDPFNALTILLPHGAESASKTCKNICAVLLWIGSREFALNLLYLSVLLFDLHNNPEAGKTGILDPCFSDEEVLIEMKSCDLLEVTQLASIILKSPVQILAEACMLSTLPGTEPAQVMSLVKHFIDSTLVPRDDLNLNLGREIKAAYFP